MYILTHPPLLSPFYIFLVIADFSDRDKKTIRYT